MHPFQSPGKQWKQRMMRLAPNYRCFNRCWFVEKSSLSRFATWILSTARQALSNSAASMPPFDSFSKMAQRLRIGRHTQIPC
jgi:hypothetical protein